MTPGFAPLTRDHGSEVLDLMQRATDYIRLEQGRDPDTTTVEAFFTDCVPGGDPTLAIKAGIRLDGLLVGIADMGFGYPAPQDAYIGLLLLDPARRGTGLGAQTLTWLEAQARNRGATRLLIAVLDANPRGRAFWAAQGFVPDRHFPARAQDPQMMPRLRMVRPIAP